MERLYEYMYRQLEQTPLEFTRYPYSRINWDEHMLGLMGPRGVGKTTLFLQRIAKEHSQDNTLYISADHIYFSDHSLFDTAESFYRNNGRYLFIDEIHKYPQWSRELKMAYDSLPDMHIYFTGSSILDIKKGEADLSRRAPLTHMQGLSFREFLKIRYGVEVPVYTLEEILQHKEELPGVAHPLPLFKEYLACGYYPFGSNSSFAIELEQVIEQTLEVDIPRFSEMTPATGRKLLKLMAIVSTLAPFKPNLTKLGSQIDASRNNIADYLNLMEKAGMISQLRAIGGGLGLLGKTEKVYLDNTNIMQVLAGPKVDTGSMRETFFLNQMRVNHDVTASQIADFQIGDITFEVGGKNKGSGQLKDAQLGYVVSDGIEHGSGNTVPLWAFGLTY